MDRAILEAMIAKARKGILTDGKAEQRGNPTGTANGRFVLFHAGMSFCSQKVRAVLAQKGIAFESNEMIIIGSRNPATGIVTAAENFYPDYVRLRLRGRDRNKMLVNGYTGSSSVSAQGLDPCAVPTLVDLVEGRVIVDSARICQHIDGAIEDVPLTPRVGREAEMMRKQIAAVDNTPHPALLYGFHPDNDTRPQLIQEGMTTAYIDKIDALTKLIAENSADAELVEAYQAKIVKESAGKAVSRDEVFQRNARSKVRAILERFSHDIADRDSVWICGNDLTLADLFWGVSLVRLQYLGLGHLWSDLTSLQGFYSRITSLASIRNEVINSTLKSMPPSDHLR
jgi:2,5-dichlorohydroquinone reductive dechlorinase